MTQKQPLTMVLGPRQGPEGTALRGTQDPHKAPVLVVSDCCKHPTTGEDMTIKNGESQSVIKNLTPHDIVIIAEDGSHQMTIASSGIARAQQRDSDAGEILGIPLLRSSFGAPDGLPEPAEGVFLIVSAITAKAAAATKRSTTDLLVTTRAVRDEAGRIIGCRALAYYS